MLDPAVPAHILYCASDYEVVRPGRFVLCAVSGARISIDSLLYWSAEHQEAYRGPAEATAAMMAGGAANLPRP
ncbi:DUF2093 domain-containing protein [Sphingomonas hengshuiensis]|uniref:DUF2093 domain-containing protein n=1 Tax=Sphingomonas hengshuiensis TaxID=1609977 RepID=A0A7U4J830_9SPHN|nr:DUF2093 domain-containing protein [Sphingomonas hengshuiensis]AJP71985.1 hypothetical protein TS85_09615 [Sphingomonas hengshuiensis]